MVPRKLTSLEIEKLAHAMKNWDKPLTPSKAVPKPEKKKRGRPSKTEE